MLKTLGPIMAFVATARPDDAKRFYAETLGFTLKEDTQWALVFDAGGTMLRVQKVQMLVPVPFTVLGWRVDDIDAAVDELNARGVAMLKFGFPGMDDRGVWTTPDGSKVAWFNDADGNVLSITQFSTMWSA